MLTKEKVVLRDTVSQSGNDEIQYEPQEERMIHLLFLHQEIKMKKGRKSNFLYWIIDSVVALPREKYRNGEECYWVLCYTYLSSQEIGGFDEIVGKLSEMFRDFSRSTYYRRKNESIRRIGDLLCGFRTSCCGSALELLYAE